MTVELILGELCGRIWHTTTEERFDGILRSGEISPEPDIPDSDRWIQDWARSTIPTSGPSVE